MAVEVGSQAPDFTLNDQNNEKVTLSSFRGSKSVLMVFYPLAFSPVCTGELCRLRDDLEQFQDADVEVLAVSVDSAYTLKAYAEQQSYRFPLLADFWPHGKVAQDYGVFNDAGGTANRGTFLVDTDGVVRFAEMNEPGEARDQGVWKQALAALPA